MGKHDCQMALTTLCIYIQRSYKGRLTFISPISYGAKFHKIQGNFFRAKFHKILFFLKKWRKILKYFWEIVSIRRSLLPSVPSSQLGKVLLTVENWNRSWLPNNGADLSFVKISFLGYISDYGKGATGVPC